MKAFRKTFALISAIILIGNVALASIIPSFSPVIDQINEYAEKNIKSVCECEQTLESVLIRDNELRYNYVVDEGTGPAQFSLTYGFVDGDINKFDKLWFFIPCDSSLKNHHMSGMAAFGALITASTLCQLKDMDFSDAVQLLDSYLVDEQLDQDYIIQTENGSIFSLSVVDNGDSKGILIIGKIVFSEN